MPENIINAWQYWLCLKILTMPENIINAWQYWQCLTILQRIINHWIQEELCNGHSKLATLSSERCCYLFYLSSCLSLLTFLCPTRSIHRDGDYVCGVMRPAGGGGGWYRRISGNSDALDHRHYRWPYDAIATGGRRTGSETNWLFLRK